MDIIRKIITTLFQLLLGLTFVFSGLVKGIDPVGTRIKLIEYMQYFELEMFSVWAMALAWALSIFEFVLGLYVIFAIRRRLTLSVIALIMLIFLPLTLFLALENPVDDCGCFGDAIVLTNWQTFWKNVVIMAMVVWISFNRQYMVKPLGKTTYTVYVYGDILLICLLAALGTWRLPFIDFRPYRPGLNLYEAIHGTQAKSGKEEYLCLYERDNEQRAFPLDSIPDEAEGWQFVDVVSHHDEPTFVKHAIGQQTGVDFFVLNDEGEEVTDSLLQQPGYTFLLLSPDLGNASEHHIDRIEFLYEYALAEGCHFYAVTLRDEEAVARWRFRTGAEYEMLYTDASIIETMIRSNPGVMLLKEGVVLWKSHLADVDIESLTTKEGALSFATLSEHSLGQIQPIERKKRVLWIFIWLAAPLLLYLPLQFVKNNFTKKHKKQ